MKKENIVSIQKSKNKSYPLVPFNPPKIFLEFQDFNLYKIKTNKQNDIYSSVRKLLIDLELDKKNIGTKKWNPFKDLIKAGQNVVIKPNLVYHTHPLGKQGIDAMITNASIIRPIIDYILLAVGKVCEITICDVPLQSTVWGEVIKNNGLKELILFYKNKNINIQLLDLRYEIAIKNKEGICRKRLRKVRDPQGYVKVNLGNKSYIQDIIKDYKKLEITDYGLGAVSKHHNPQKNEYLIPQTILDADVFINVPKMKTHRKAGVTLSMKNIIGINADKSWIAHHRRGIDEYPRFNLKDYLKWRLAYYLKVFAPKWFITLFYRTYRAVCLKGESIKKHDMIHGGTTMEGNWHGNDTIWRTILDMNNILFFVDKKGKMQKEQQRKYITIIDGIIGMEKEGPMDGYPKKCGILIGGTHPIVVDYITAKIMGFNHQKIPKIREGFKEKYWGLVNFIPEEIKTNLDKLPNFKFIPSKGWKGYVEE